MHCCSKLAEKGGLALILVKSRVLKKTERIYISAERMCIAAVLTVQKKALLTRGTVHGGDGSPVSKMADEP